MRAAEKPTGHFATVGHRRGQAGQRIVPRKTGAFLDAAERSQPLRRAQGAGHEGAEGGEEIEIFDNPLSAVDDLGRRYGLSRQIEIERTSYVYPVGGGKEPEGAANARIDIEDFVCSVTQVA